MTLAGSSSELVSLLVERSRAVDGRLERVVGAEVVRGVDVGAFDDVAFDAVAFDAVTFELCGCIKCI